MICQVNNTRHENEIPIEHKSDHKAPGHEEYTGFGNGSG